jgi:1-deoxy-D-xylulose-5-phosphate reductoisomerase
MIKLSILGSTGSVGTQALDVVRAYRQDIELVGLVARRASDKLLNQARECVYLKGEEGLLAVVEESERVLNAISGIDGL